MKILVTGSGGFVGKNLVAALHNIRSGKDRTHPGLSVSEIFEYDIHTYYPAEYRKRYREKLINYIKKC